MAKTDEERELIRSKPIEGCGVGGGVKAAETSSRSDQGPKLGNADSRTRSSENDRREQF